MMRDDLDEIRLCLPRLHLTVEETATDLGRFCHRGFDHAKLLSISFAPALRHDSDD